MTMMQNEQRKFCKTEEYKDTTFIGAVYFVSHGEGKDVSLDWSFSHDFEDTAAVPAPACLKALRDVWYSLNDGPASLPTGLVDIEELKGLSMEDAHKKILDKYQEVKEDEPFADLADDSGVRH
jgi:hypothetical protein